MKPGILFDLGNTLAAYYRPEQFLPILRVAIADLLAELRKRGLARVSFEDAFSIAEAENVEATDFRFTPMAERLGRIFRLPPDADPASSDALCEIFLRPIFAVGRLYDDTIPTLRRLRADGYPLAIVSNSPWGSPPDRWRVELQRLRLAQCVDEIVFCGDVGWRKPAPEIFRFAASALNRRPNDCIFVGDDLQWDIGGSEAVGMRAVLLDRAQRHQNHPGERFEDLYEFLEHFGVGHR